MYIKIGRTEKKIAIIKNKNDNFDCYEYLHYNIFFKLFMNVLFVYKNLGDLGSGVSLGNSLLKKVMTLDFFILQFYIL